MGRPSNQYIAEYILCHNIKEFSPVVDVGYVFIAESWSKNGIILVRKADRRKYSVTFKQFHQCFMHVG